MPYGYNGKILRVNLSQGTLREEMPEENFYRKYLGGRGFISYYLLNELAPGIEPLGPQNLLVLAAGPVTGAPVGGAGRNSVGAKSPLSGSYGDAEVGGYWGAELKRAGYDAIVVEGKAEKPAYLWIRDGAAEIRDARHLWGKPTLEAQALVREELGDPYIRTALIGPAGEKMVRFACVMNDINHAAGRSGMGAVMGSKNLKGIAARGHTPVSLADPEAVTALAEWLRDNFRTMASGMHDQGTAGGLFALNRQGGLPTRNFREGAFEGVSAINGRTLRDTILVARRSCWACPVRCKREVAADEPYRVSPSYGGPEYETLASLGSNCGIDNLVAIAKGNELCNAYGLDTISTGVAISFAMECFEGGLLSRKDTNGLELNFGNADAMVKMVELIGKREGLGRLLGEGVARAAKEIGKGAEQYAMHIKGQEVPMHEPRFKQGMGLGYTLSPTGADHCHNLHDNLYTAESPQLEQLKIMGILDPLPLFDLSAAKVRMLAYQINWEYLMNCMVICRFPPFDLMQHVELVRAVTGWNTTAWELLKVGERCVNLTRAFNVREGFTAQDDNLPQRFFTPLLSGALEGTSIKPGRLQRAKRKYYRMMGWHGSGVPRRDKLEELDIGWAKVR